ncbi:MlaC/ttg2D family ABC transporter substrate-binding protein [Parapedomonas caeni]
MRSTTSLVLAAMLAAPAVTAPLMATPALAQQAATVDPKAASGFIQSLSDKAFAVLRDASLSQAQRDQKFRTLLQEGFALDVIGNSVLGTARRTATPEQLRAFHAAFPDYVIRIYATRLTEYGNSQLKVTGTTPAPRGDIYVRTLVTGPKVQQPVRADWRLRQTPDRGLKIIDLSLEGVSMAVTQRDEFTVKIQSKGLDALIAEIRTGGTASAAARPASPGKSK